MVSYLIIILMMGLIFVIFVFKPELGIQFKAFTEKFAFDAEWKPSKSTKWRFVLTGILIEVLFLALILLSLFRR